MDQVTKVTLIDRARLTKEEKATLFEACCDNGHPTTVDYKGGNTGHTGECFAEAQLTKALWAAVDWLYSESNKYFAERDNKMWRSLCVAAGALGLRLEADGLERGKGAKNEISKQ